MEERRKLTDSKKQSQTNAIPKIVQPLWKTVCGLLKKTKNATKTTISSRNSTLGYNAKTNK